MLGYDWLCFDMRLQDMHITWAQLYKKTYIYIFLSCGTPGMSSPKTPSDGPTEMLCTMPCDASWACVCACVCGMCVCLHVSVQVCTCVLPMCGMCVHVCVCYNGIL